MFELVRILVTEYDVDVNSVNAKGRTLLSYVVEAGDSASGLARLLINCGARVQCPLEEDGQHNLESKLSS